MSKKKLPEPSQTGNPPEETDQNLDATEGPDRCTDMEEKVEDLNDSQSPDLETSTGPESSDDQNNQPVSQENHPLEITIQSVIEAVLFATDEPVTPHKLAEIVGAGGIRDVKDCIKELNKKYETIGSAFRIEHIANGYQMLTLKEFNPWLSKLIKVRSESKLTPAALETLAIIAYKQPIMRAEIENIRGVAAGEMVRQLIDKGLVKITGRAEELGRPLLYGTTKKFLEIFGLGSLKDLPNPDDFKQARKELKKDQETDTEFSDKSDNADEDKPTDIRPRNAEDQTQSIAPVESNHPEE